MITYCVLSSSFRAVFEQFIFFPCRPETTPESIDLITSSSPSPNSRTESSSAQDAYTTQSGSPATDVSVGSTKSKVTGSEKESSDSEKEKKKRRSQSKKERLKRAAAKKQSSKPQKRKRGKSNRKKSRKAR